MWKYAASTINLNMSEVWADPVMHWGYIVDAAHVRRLLNIMYRVDMYELSGAGGNVYTVVTNTINACRRFSITVPDVLLNRWLDYFESCIANQPHSSRVIDEAYAAIQIITGGH